MEQVSQLCVFRRRGRLWSRLSPAGTPTLVPEEPPGGLGCVKGHWQVRGGFVLVSSAGRFPSGAHTSRRPRPKEVGPKEAAVYSLSSGTPGTDVHPHLEGGRLRLGRNWGEMGMSGFAGGRGSGAAVSAWGAQR